MPKDSEPKDKLSSVLSGVAGEYFVAAELTARRYIASITLRNTKGVDILCSNADASKSVAIQIKTNKSSKRDWILKQKSENNIADNFFYVFVNLNDNLKSPDYFIVPSKVVALYSKETNDKFLKTLGRGGMKHKATTMRKFSDFDEKYLNRWDLLGL